MPYIKSFLKYDEWMINIKRSDYKIEDNIKCGR